jgi:hypothetical protein
MTTSIAAAMRVMERGDLAAAERAFGDVAGSARDLVIARFRRAECLSRLGRHDEAVEHARAAFAGGGVEPAPWVWMAGCLAEAGRLGEIAGAAVPAAHAEELTPLRDGYAALARVARGDRREAERTAEAILATRHQPLYSLALRVAETQRLATEPRWPDVPSTWYAHECALEMKDARQTAHSAPPPATSPGKAVRWLRLHWSCSDWKDLVAELRAHPKPPDGLDECEIEQHLAFGRVDAAREVATRVAREVGDDASGELCVALSRVPLLAGAAIVPSRLPGWEDARRRLGPTIAWIEMASALIEGRVLDARPLADRIADPAHREFVEAALLRWSRGPSPRAASAP